MKKLFKHLAIVLALALVIGLVPARTAEAADYSLKFKNKYLYVGAKGETAHGVDSVGNLPAKPIKRSLKFGGGVIEGLKDGDVVTFKSADRAVARGSKKYQRVFAIGVGETDVAVKVNGEEIGSMHFIVKQNAKSLAIDAASELGIGDVEVKVNVEPATATDIISLVIPEEYKDIAVVKEGTTITTKKPGTFKIQAVAQQNDSTLTGYHVKSEEVELQAAVKVISATQKSANQVTFVFDNDMTGIADAKDFKVYYKPVTGADVTTAVKSVTIASEDGKTVVVTLWNNFIEDTEYFVEYSGQVTKFTTAKLDIAHAAQIRFNETEITKGKVTDYDFDILDANGVEMDYDAMNSYVTFAGTSTDKIQVGDRTILFDEAGLQVSVTATFDAWYEDSEGNAKENKFQNAALFKSVDVTPVTLSKYYWTLGNDADKLYEVSDFDEPNHLVAVEDEANKLSYLKLLLEFSDGSYLTLNSYGTPAAYDRFAEPGDDDDATFALDVVDYLSVEIADPGIAESDNGLIKPVKVGTTQILIKVEDQDKPFLVLPLDVKAKAVVSTLSVTAVDDKTKLNLNPVEDDGHTAFTDNVGFKVVVKDQYDRAMRDVEVEVSEASHTKDAGLAADFAVADTSAKGVTYAFFDRLGTATDTGKILGAGVTVIKFTATKNGKSITNSTKSIQSDLANGAVATYKLVLDDDSLDQIIGSARNIILDAPVSTGVYYYPLDSKGYTLAEPDPVTLYDKTALLTGATGEAYRFKAFAGGKELAIDGAYNKTEYVGDGFFSAVRAKTGEAVEKLDASSVSIKLYKVVVEQVTVNGVPTKRIKTENSIDTKTVEITDSQPKLKIKKVADKVANAASIGDAIKAAYNSSDYTAPVTFTSADGTKSIFVKTATYTEDAGNTGTVDLTGSNAVVTASVGYTLVIE